MWLYFDYLHKYINEIYIGEQRQATACTVARNSHLSSGTYVLFNRAHFRYISST
jgi:hypothetical protein